MTSLSHRYPDFGSKLKSDSPLVPTGLPAADEDSLEDMQLAAFDSGYQAGWEDAVKANTSQAGQAAVDIAQNLQDMSYSHREAYLKLSAAMKPLMTQILDKLLPQAARQMVGAHILEQLTMLMDNHAETAIEIAVSSQNMEPVQSLLGEMVKLPFTLIEDASLTSGQAFMRTGEAEREINLDAVLSGISEALDAFYEQTKEEMMNG